MGPKYCTEGIGLNKQLRSSYFIVAFVVCCYIFGFSKGLSRQLQGMSLDIITAYESVDLITDELRKVLTDDVAEFSKLYADCIIMSEDA